MTQAKKSASTRSSTLPLTNASATHTLVFFNTTKPTEKKPFRGRMFGREKSHFAAVFIGQKPISAERNEIYLTPPLVFYGTRQEYTAPSRVRSSGLI